jgi:hypothetical protein
LQSTARGADPRLLDHTPAPAHEKQTGAVHRPEDTFRPTLATEVADLINAFSSNTSEVAICNAVTLRGK